MADNTSIEERCPGTCCEGGFALGRHMTVEFYDCDPKALADAELVKTVFLRAAEKSGATVIDANFHEFEPQGVSGVVVISESHFAITPRWICSPAATRSISRWRSTSLRKGSNPRSGSSRAS